MENIQKTRDYLSVIIGNNNQTIKTSSGEPLLLLINKLTDLNYELISNGITLDNNLYLRCPLKLDELKDTLTQYDNYGKSKEIIDFINENETKLNDLDEYFLIRTLSLLQSSAQTIKMLEMQMTGEQPIKRMRTLKR